MRPRVHARLRPLLLPPPAAPQTPPLVPQVAVHSAIRLAANGAMVVYRKEGVVGAVVGVSSGALVAKQELLTGDKGHARVMVAERPEQGAAHVERRVVHGTPQPTPQPTTSKSAPPSYLYQYERCVFPLAARAPSAAQ